MHSLRIIGGRWRNRKIIFPDSAHLRPTPDRVRETVFNWLASSIVGARVLDLFAGSGALGFEALSRGAAHAVLVDNASVVVNQLRHTQAQLQADTAEIIKMDAMALLRQGSIAEAFNIVFLDPPFQQPLIVPCCELLLAHGWLANGGLVYTELPSDTIIDMPLQCVRDKAAGNVRYQLWQRSDI